MVKTFKKQAGVHLVLLSLFMFVLLSLCGLVAGLGFIVLDNLKLQNTLNAATLGALNGYLEQESSNVATTPQNRVEKAVLAAKNIFRENNFYSGKNYIGESWTGYNYNNSSSKLEFGTWNAKETAANAGNCPSGYPCFSVIDPLINSNNVTAVRITINKSLGNGTFVAPFAKVAGFLPDGVFQPHGVAIASSAPKCISLLLDISDVSTKDSHEHSLDPVNWTVVNGASKKIDYPLNPGIFAYDVSTAFDCAISKPGENTLLKSYWCNMENDRATKPTALHALTDYKKVGFTRRGQFYVDRYNRPEPLKSYLDAFNALMQDYALNISQYDRIVGYVFDDMNSSLTPTGFVDRIPEYGTGVNSYPALNETGFLAQLYNIENIGTVGSNGEYLPGKQPVHPNMVDRGWFPDISNTNSGRVSNLPLAIRKAMGEMNSFCPQDSSKSMIVASHGVFKSAYQDNGLGQAQLIPISSFAEYDNFTENRMLAPGPYDKATTTVWQRSILFDAQDWGISISFIFNHNRVNPNFCNRLSPKTFALLPFKELFSAGKIPIKGSDCTNVDNMSLSQDYYPVGALPACAGSSSECTFKHIGDASNNEKSPGDNLYFRYPNYSLSKLAYGTAGVFCPLLKLAPDSEYNHKNVPEDQLAFTPEQLNSKDPTYERVENQTQVWKTEKLTHAASGVACLRKITGQIKSFLVNN